MKVGRRSSQQPRSGCLALAVAMLIGASGLAAAPPTPEEYVLKVGGGARIVPAPEIRREKAGVIERMAFTKQLTLLMKNLAAPHAAIQCLLVPF